MSKTQPFAIGETNRHPAIVILDFGSQYSELIARRVRETEVYSLVISHTTSAEELRALNPKGIIFFVAFLPQFITPAAGASGQLWTLAITFVVLATINATLYAVFAAAARRALTSPRASRRFSLVGGSLLSAAGIWALLARRAA